MFKETIPKLLIDFQCHFESTNDCQCVDEYDAIVCGGCDLYKYVTFNLYTIFIMMVN
jgi:hypothetical protein